MHWYVYGLGPIDFGWEYVRTVTQTLAGMITRQTAWEDETPDVNASLVEQFMSTWESAKAAARRAGWEGDFRRPPAVFWLPDADLSLIMGFIIKQDNNGTTFVVSPVPLVHLRDYEGG